MSQFMPTRLEAGLHSLASLAGLNHIDGGTRRAVARMAGLTAVAWLLVVLSPFIGAGGTIAAVVVLTGGLAALAGGMLLAGQANHELAMLLAAAPPPLPSAPPSLPEPVPTPVSSSRLSAAARLLSHGELHGRRYAVYSDGSIEMDTMFGTRWFASLEVAREFIGLRNGAVMSGLHLN